ncbi:MAG: hypothetical protein AAGE83_04330, partial [Pseudomonadota bacterium]
VQTAEAEALGPTGPAAQDPAERPAAVAVPPLRPREAPAPATRPATPTIVTEAAPAPAAATPDTRPATEPVQPLASTPATPPLGIAEAPPLPEREPEQEPEVAEEERPEVETAVETEVAEVAPETSTVPRARPRPPEPEPTRTAEAAKPEPEAEEKPDDDVLAALNAANASIESVDKAKGETKKKPAASAASTQRAATAPNRAAKFSRGEKEGLALSLKPYFRYPGRRDPGLFVIVKAAFNPDGSFRLEPTKVNAGGGDAATQGALYRAATVALRRAQSQGVFAKLGAKLSTWRSVEFRFTPDEQVRLSS